MSQLSPESSGLPVVRLDSSIGTALVVSHPTGVFYVNQAGGTACMQPGMEGALVPFGNDVAIDGNVLMSAQEALEAYFTGPKHGGTGATSGLDQEDADAIDAIFAKTEYGSSFKVDRDRLKDSMEAWVHVTVNGVGSTETAIPGTCWGFLPFPRSAVLTWMNSD